MKCNRIYALSSIGSLGNYLGQLEIPLVPLRVLHDRLQRQVVPTFGEITLLASLASIMLGLTVEDPVHRLLHHHLGAVVAFHVVIVICLPIDCRALMLLVTSMLDVLADL